MSRFSSTPNSKRPNVVNINSVTASSDTTLHVSVTTQKLEESSFKSHLLAKAGYEDLLKEFSIHVDEGEVIAQASYYSLTTQAWLIKSIGKENYVSVPSVYVTLKGNPFWALFKTLVTACGYQLVSANCASYEGISGIKSVDMKDVTEFISYLKNRQFPSRRMARKLVTSLAHQSWISQAKRSGIHQSAISCIIGSDKSLSTILNLNSGSKGSQLIACVNRLYNILKERTFPLTEESFLPPGQYGAKIAKPAYENRGIFTEAEITYFGNLVSEDRQLPADFSWLKVNAEYAAEIRAQFTKHTRAINSVISLRQPVLFGDMFSKKKKLSLNDKIRDLDVTKILTIFAPVYLEGFKSRSPKELKQEFTDELIASYDVAARPILIDYKKYVDFYEP